MVWLVIEFDDANNSTSLVPKSWLFEDNSQCFCSKYGRQFKFNKAVQKEPMPDRNHMPQQKFFIRLVNIIDNILLLVF